MKEKWTIQINNTKYEDIKTYTILEPNPDAGKSGVCYSGKYFGVCTLDSQEDTNLIVSAVNACIEINPDNPQVVAEAIKDMYWALKSTISELEEYLFPDTLEQIKQAISKAVGR